MRLVELSSTGKPILTKDFVGDDGVPAYAILSHTWAEGEEVTFEDLTNGSGNDKSGYEKIRFCGERARQDGLRYFWVDTCCINKANFTELSQAINSMFHWYQNAAKCYVYLSDVSTRKRKASDQFSEHPWESAFRKSRWFKRGWTLQELLAPGSVEFFSRDHERLGDKRTLERQIHEITKIPLPALQGAPLSQFTVEERFSWAENRRTTQKEDKAYSLLGIFDVYMPLIYGEGENNAFDRLREAVDKPLKAKLATSIDTSALDGLPYAVDAPFNSYAKQGSPSCLPDTRVDLLNEIYSWAEGKDERHIFWLNGLAGTGKSTIARTVARTYFDKRRLGASFFFSRGGGDVSHASKFCTTVAAQLANNIPTLRRHICDSVTDRGDIAGLSLLDQWRQLVLRPLSKLDGNGCPSSYVLLIDALDECDGDENIRMIVQLLGEARSLKKVQLRVFLTSRPEVPVRYSYQHLPQNERCDIVLHNISSSTINHDLFIFFEDSLLLIGKEDGQDVGWPGAQVIKSLVQSACGLFIWAATACRFIREGLFPDERLHMLLQGDAASAATPEDHLNGIYLTVLQKSVQPGFSMQDKERFHNMLIQILGAVVVLLSPLSADSLSKLLATPRQKMDRMLKDLHAILDIPKDDIFPLRLHHPSFRDFLVDKSRCSDSNFWVDEKQAHQRLADSCIQLMSTYLKQDICELNAPAAPVSEVEDSRVEQHLPPEIRYACLYWVEHLQKSNTRLCDSDDVHQFLQTSFLYWLEALGWMRRISEGILAITTLESMAFASDCTSLFNFINDMKRFTLYSRQTIEQAPLQTYCSALTFAPKNSIIRMCFENKIPEWIRKLPQVSENWGALLQTLGGHLHLVNVVVFSPDGKTLASASYDKTVKLWDASSGILLHTLEGHSDWINAVSFSPDGKTLASASNDKTVKLWDARSGVLLQTLGGHLGLVKAVSFSPDGKTLVSASYDKTVKLWDAGSGALLQTFQGHSERIEAVSFSPDGKTLASASHDRTVKLWEAGSSALLQTCEGHLGSVILVSFSPDGMTLASASKDGTVRLWDAGSGGVIQTFQAHSYPINAVSFSPEGKTLASASGDTTVRLWDARSGVLLQTLGGHLDLVKAVSFSPDGKTLVSASYDKTVKLWDAGSGALLQTFQGHSERIEAVSFSPDGKTVVSASFDNTVKLWDAGSRSLMQAFQGHSDWINAVAFSPDGKTLASASWDKTVKLWDAGSGALLQTCEGHSNWVMLVSFSPDGMTLASASFDRTIRLWDVGSTSLLQIFRFYPGVNAMSFSLDGKTLALATDDATVELWDSGSGAILQKFEGHLSVVMAVSFSPDGKTLASASDDKTVKLWDAGSGGVIQTFQGHSIPVNAVAFSPDGKTLVSVSCDNILKLWDTGSGTLLQTFLIRDYIDNISYSDGGIFLSTNRGQLGTVFRSGGAVTLGSSPRQSIYVGKQWVRRGGENLLWLPFEYRPDKVAVYNNTVALGYQSGQVLIMEFAF